MTEPRFVPALGLMLSGLLAWAAHFLLIYGYTGLLCQRPEWARTEIGGLGVVPLGIAILTGVTLAALAAILAWNGLLQPRQESRDALFEAPFYRQLTQGAALLGAVGIVWEGLFSIFLVPSCW